MKNRFRGIRVLALVIALAILLPCVPAQARSTVYVAKIGSTNYTSWEKAWSAAINSNKKTIDMLTDWTTDEDLVVPNNVTVTLNMHGHMINRKNTDPDDIHYGSDWLGSGTVIRVTEGASLTIVGKSSDLETSAHSGRLYSGTWYYNGKGGNVINGALITGGATDGVYSAISVDKKATLKMTDVTVAGNVSDTFLKQNGFGGGLCVSGVNTTVELNKCTFCYNYAGNNGGAISIDNVYSTTIKIRNSSIFSNDADGRGGGIYIGENCDGLTLDLTGTKIETNRARNGGGIYILDEGVTVTGATLNTNTTTESGGGVYVKSTDCILRKLTVTGNRATSQGGGIYIRQEDNTLDNCTVKQNSAKEGGGVFMSNSNYIYTPTLILMGKVIIQDNTASNVSCNSDLLLQDSGSNPAKIIYNSLTSGSAIYVLCKNRVITYKSGSFNERFFYADEEGKCVYWGQDKSNEEEYRQLVVGKGTQNSDDPVVTLNPGDVANGTAMKATSYTYTPQEPVSGAAGNYTVWKGYGQDDGSSRDLLPYYYSDGYFLDEPTLYNTHLATLSLTLELTAFNSNTGKDTKGNKLGNTARFTRVKQMLADIGCDDEKTYISESYMKSPTTDSIAFAIGQKELLNASGEDTGYILVPVVVRGGGYGKEWASNVTLGTSGNHEGFNTASEQIMSALQQYVQDRDLTTALAQGKVRFWVVGFSRGGATANLTAKKLIDLYGDAGNAVYGYTFEAPQGGTGSEIKAGSNYNSIHNIINQSDVVPHVAMIAMNFMRYGVDHYVPGGDAGTPTTFLRRYAGMLSHGTKSTHIDGSDADAVYTKDNEAWDTDTKDYANQKKTMLTQLKALPGSVFFDDYFHLATISPTSLLFDDSILTEFGNDYVTLSEWLQDFIFYMNYWLAGTNARETYVGSTYEGYQAALRRLMELKEGTGFNIGTAFSRVDAGTIKTLISDLISGDLTPRSLYDVLCDAGVFDTDGVPLTYEEASDVVDIVMCLLKGDLTDVGDYPYKTLMPYGDDDEYLVQFGTLLYNATNMMLNHNVYVTEAWVRSYDSYYLGDSEVSSNRFKVRAATDDEVDTPYITFMYDGQEITLHQGEVFTIQSSKASEIQIYLHTTERNKGGAIYYAVKDEYGKSETTLYQKPITLKATDNWSYVRIDAHTLWYDTPSKDVGFGIKFDATLHDVYVDGELYGAYNERETVTIQADLIKDNGVFSSWKYYSHTKSQLGTVTENGNTLTFTMPGKDVRLGTNYVTATVAAPVCNLENNSTFSDVRMASFSTPSGASDDGFHITCEVTAVYPNMEGSPEEHYTETDTSLVLTGSRDSKVIYKITAYATKEGWNDSEKSYFEFTIDYSLQCHTLTVINGLIYELFRQQAQFYAGDTVTVEVVKTGTVQTRSEDGTLTQRADSGYYFDSWQCTDESISFEDPTAEQITFTMPNDDVTIEAVMLSRAKYNITVERGKACNANGEEITQASAGETVYLKADDPQTDSYGVATETFNCWTGNVTTFHNSSAPETYFVMPTDQDLTGGIQITATFNGVYSLTVNNGTALDSSGDEITHAESGDPVTLKVNTHDSKYSFVGWSTTPELSLDDATAEQAMFDMPDQDVTATALLAARITVVNGHAEDSGGSTIEYALSQDAVTLIADDAPAGKVFSHWEIEQDTDLSTRDVQDYGDTQNPRCTFAMPAYPIVATAVYTEAPPDTGDRNHALLYLILALGALALLAGLRAGRRRRS